MENKNEPTIYKGFEIHCVFNYSDGRGDYNVYPPNADYGYIALETTVGAIEVEIDEKLAES